MQNKVVSSVIGNDDLIKRMHRKQTAGRGNYSLQTDDVMVSMNKGKDSNSLNQICFTFAEGFLEMLKGEKPYIGIALWQNRVYFIPTDDPYVGFKGYATSTMKQKKTFRFTPEDKNELESYKNFIGSHGLNFNSDRQLYYIESGEIKA